MNKDMNRLKVVFAETKRTSRWLAEQLGKDQATVSKWCTNTSQPSLETLFQIAECLGVKVQDLISKDSHIIADIAERIERLITNARANVARVVNITEVITKYEIGRIIVNVVQEGEERATYGKQLLKGVSEVLTERLGDGWSVETLKRCRKFFTIYSVKQIGTTVLTESSDGNLVNTVDQIQKTVKSSTKLTDTYPFTLSWSHYLVLMRIESEAERSFYEIECHKQNWSVRQLQRQYNSSLYERLALSRDKEAVMRLAQEGQTINNPDDIIKNPLTLEFLGLPEKDRYSEEDLEQKIIDNIQKFLLELGKGFTFVGRQYPLTVNNIHYHVDLVFYHRILKCFVLIDLKKNSVQHVDIGQMNMYMGYFAKEENMADDNPPIGIILSHNKDELLVEYATYGMDSNLFVSKYELYLPDRKELQKLVNNILEQDEKKKADK